MSGKKINNKSSGQNMYELAQKLFPICRSITGRGVRETLDIIADLIPLEIKNIPTGTQVLDWTVPKEWGIKDAWIKNSSGDKIIHFKNNNLHVMNYSVSIDKKVTLDDLKKHLHTDPAHPDWIPYRTSYYKEDWGFCLSENQLKELSDDTYHVYIDSTLEEGNLTYGECFIPGESANEMVLSAHICHPSLANDNLSGISLLTELVKQIKQRSRCFSYRFLFIPGTIGAISWLSQNENNLDQIKHGLVVSCVGDSGKFSYKKSRSNSEIDQIVTSVLEKENIEYELLEFSPYGYDERQFSSPAFNLPFGSLTRSRNGTYPEYHTSADNLDFISADALGESFNIYSKIIDSIDSRKYYINQQPKGEPQLGKRGLYDALGGSPKPDKIIMAMLWILNYSDGNHSLEDITEKAGIETDLMNSAVDLLVKNNLLKQI